jgi:HEPN domain-containing protein
MDYQGLYESTAKAELGVARRLAAQGDYWTAVYHCQQAAEKMAKAVLSKLGVVEVKEHIVSGLFASRILRHRRDPDLQKAYRALLKLEEHLQKARYPMPDPEDKLITPMERYGARDAEDAIARAEFVILTLQKLLAEPAPTK